MKKEVKFETSINFERIPNSYFSLRNLLIMKINYNLRILIVFLFKNIA